MEQRDLSTLTDDELQAEAKKLQPSAITNALFIGFLFGIVLYSVFNSSFGLFMLIPLYMIYRLVNDPKNKQLKEIEAILQKRKL